MMELVFALKFSTSKVEIAEHINNLRDKLRESKKELLNKPRQLDSILGKRQQFKGTA